MADFKLIGDENLTVTNQLGSFTQGIGFPLRDVDSAASIQSTTVLEAASLVDQVPSGTDAPLQMTFGAAQFGPSDPVQLSAAGIITFNQSGIYNISFRYLVTRDTTAGIAQVFTRALFNGAPIVPAVDPIGLLMNTANTTIPVFQQLVTSIIEPTDTVAVEFYRDSNGVDSGSLLTLISSIGWGTSPSAFVRIIKLG